jgi:hypothetical protein
MNFRNKCLLCCLTAIGAVFHAARAAAQNSPPAPEFRGALLSARDVDEARLRKLQEEGFTAVLVMLQDASGEQASRQRTAADLVLRSRLELHYWIEVARCPELADAHPDWMASLQTHDEWRRLFPDAPRPAADEVAKTYPWVPILSREPFQAQLNRVKTLLGEMPQPTGLFLNDLQGAPSACGCGSPLCRWTSDYGDKRTTTPLADDAAAQFVKAVERFVPDSEVIPVWTTECELHDGAQDGACAGVDCFNGICWKAYTRQLMPVQQTSKRLAVLVPFRAFQRDLPIYGPQAGWIQHAIASFAEMPPEHGGEAVSASRLIAVLQGWDVPADDVAAQIAMARGAGAGGYIVAQTRIEQGWQPRIVRWK